MSPCRLCRNGITETFFSLPDLPLVGSFARSREEALAMPRYPLDWRFCPQCGGIQLGAPVEDQLIFGEDYSFATGTIPSLVTHFGELAQQFADWYQPSSVLEFGSNDGTLLEQLRALGIKAVGVDPSANVAALANAKGLETHVGFLSPSLAEQITAVHGRFDIVTGSNCFAHNVSVHPVLEAIVALLKPEGQLCLEVIYAGDVRAKLQWDSLYHEHSFCYSLTALKSLLGQYGLTIVHAERLQMHAGSLRIYATPARNPRVIATVDYLLREEQMSGLTGLAEWQRFGRQCRDTIDQARQVVDGLSGQYRFWGYGASGRAAMWANACGQTGFEAIVDASPLRAGRYLPGTGTPIISPAESLLQAQPDFMFIYAWNYADAIVRQVPDFSGTWVTPLPRLSFFRFIPDDTNAEREKLPNGFRDWINGSPGQEIAVTTIRGEAVSHERYALLDGLSLVTPAIGDTVAPRFLFKRKDEIVALRLIHNYHEANDRLRKLLSRTERVVRAKPAPQGGRLNVVGGHANFYHFITNYLARCYFYRDGEGFRPEDRFLVEAGLPPSYFDYFDLIGLPREQIVLAPGDKFISCETAYFSSLPHYFDGDRGGLCGIAEAFDWLRGEIRKRVPPAGKGRRIMLSREGAIHRRILNEEELYAIAAKLGFELLQPEKHPVRDVLSRLAACEVLVTPFGAGATNGMFVGDGARVIELAGQNSIRKLNTAAVCSLSGASLIRIVGEEQSSDKDWPYADLIIPPADFRLAIGQALDSLQQDGP